MLSFGTIILLLALVIVALFIFSRLFSTNTKNQLALENISAPISEPTRYHIQPPFNDTVKSTLSRSPGAALVSDGGEDVSSTKSVEPETGGDKDISKPIENEPSSSDEKRDDGEMPDIKPDSQLYPLDVSKLQEPIPLAKGPETLYIKVPVGRVRKAPSIDAEILFYLKKGDRVSVIDTRDGW
jgi:hypothetical protein